uniref:EOG090X04EN n=1 Tax=Evadne anonyx TaxID=141404 RepID=A0A9N6ZF91_9CRUS|nr:EOG090X04EN [Evadne anonyx]
MGTSSEDVLLMVPHVKLKKKDGVFYLMNERLGWMVENESTFSITHKYADIKIQKISPEGKSKVQLQVCLHDGEATTFQFTNPEGSVQQVKDRDSIKDLLQDLLPKFKRTINKDLEEKNKLLVDNPQLLQLYDLVINQADIKPQTDGCNGSLRYSLTTELMASIFRTYPSVKQKHLKYVPAKMTEEAFWTSFFQSHYLHRDRHNTDQKDMFTECGKQDELVLKEISTVKDPLLDLTALKDINDDDSIPTIQSTKVTNTANQNMIRRFNQHSILVLKASEQSEKEQSLAPNPIDPAPQKRQRLIDAVSYDDLESSHENNFTQLNLSRVERYLNGPTAVAHQPNSTANGSSSLNSDLDGPTFNSIVDTWMKCDGYNPLDVLKHTSAVAVLGELSVGGSLMRGAQENSTTHLSKELQKELKQIYGSLSEILRHFWATIPPSTKQLMDKATHMVDALHRFNQAKLSPFEQKLIRESTESESILRPLRYQIEAAIRKHSQWQPVVGRNRL